MATNQQLQKALNEIEFALRQNESKVSSFEDANYTVGWISSTIERINKCDPIY